ncbi:MAG TPA: imidazole glycerol phosphate synthase subunit HisF [Candidatus Thermoplasmatota archaeon]|nr:imidazole glycerol phosphate synthase subunit HisF [Candidatus Thermoplasmatota archaeon]
MLRKRVIPCLDVKDGRVVKGVRFRDLEAVGDPVAMAVAYERQGADEIVFLDVSASQEGRATLLDVVRQTAENLFVPLTVGGGVATMEDVHRVLNAGADKVAMNTAAVRNPALITDASREYGAQCVVVAIDAKREGNAGSSPAWSVHTHGGTRPTGLDAVAWARRAAELGGGEILLTSMDADGTEDGYDLALTRAVSRAAGVPIVASGGAGNPRHMVEALREGEADAALAASVFHYGKFTVGDVKRALAEAGVPVREAGLA